MPTNLREFNRKMGTFAKRMPVELVTTFQRRMALDALSRIVKKTPVDTGRARNNWQTAVSRVPTGTLGKRGNPEGRGMTAVQRVPFPSTIYITNNLPYIVALENGHSQQAGNGMVAVTIAEIAIGFG